MLGMARAFLSTGSVGGDLTPSVGATVLTWDDDAANDNFIQWDDGNRGYIYRALGYGTPHVNASRGSTTAQMAASRDYGQFSVLEICKPTHIINALGRNDIFNGRTAAQTKADIITGNAKYSGLGKVYGVTIPPWTSSTDSWATVANQTPQNSGYEAQRIIYNADIRANYASWGLAGVIDVSAYCEDATVAGKWRADIAATPDGVHPGPAVHALIAATMPESWFV
jgi:lysophospholipase L1-like esterase